MRKILAPVLCLAIASLFSGCVTQLKSDIAPGAKLDDIKKLYVVRLEADKRGVEKMIADRLNLMGRQATSGERANIPADVDAIVTYQDKWAWDITMYMIRLDVQVRKPQTDIAIGTGHALRTSLVRKSPPEMVQSVLAEIFKTQRAQ